MKGKRVKLLYTSDIHTRLKPDAEGVVKFVDSMGTVHVQWDDGSSLGLIPNEDMWEVLG